MEGTIFNDIRELVDYDVKTQKELNERLEKANNLVKLCLDHHVKKKVLSEVINVILTLLETETFKERKIQWCYMWFSLLRKSYNKSYFENK